MTTYHMVTVCIVIYASYVIACSSTKSAVLLGAGESVSSSTFWANVTSLF